jgi:hypothetical protein
MSQQTLELLSDEQVEPSLLESRYPEIIASVGSIDSYDSIVSVGSIASVASINSVDLIAAEDSLAVKYSPDSEYSLGLENFGDSEYSLDAEIFGGSAYSLDAEIFGDSAYSLDAENFLEAENFSFVQGIDVDSLTGVSTDSTAYARGPRPRTTTALLDPQLAIRKFSYNNLAEVTATVRVTLSPLVKFYIEQDFVDITLEASVWGIDRRRNSHLFNFSDQLITGEGTYTFNTFVNSKKLDEDTGFFQDGPTDEIATQFRLISSDPALVGVNLTAWTNQVHGRY